MKKYTKTILSEGKNNFKNNIFTFNEWSAPTTNDPDVIKWLISSFKLVGRKIEGFRTIGNSSYHTRQYIEGYAYKHSKIEDENERKEKSKYDNIPPNIRFNRSLLLEKPFLIEFEDEQVFEVISRFPSEFRLSMDAISCIDFDENIHSNLLFYPCIGKSISSVEIKTFSTDKDPLFGEYFDKEHSKVELVEKIILWLDDGNGISLKCGFAAFFQVNYINSDYKIKRISFENLKKGLMNWEDLHNDETLGFRGKSASLFTNEKKISRADDFVITLYTDKKTSKLNISIFDFLLFDLSITIFTNCIFDEYDDYEFTKEQWNLILIESEKLLSFTLFDDLFEYLKNKNINNCNGMNYLLTKMNIYGVEFWNDKSKFKTQLDDIRRWSDLLLSDCDTIKIMGI